MINEHSDMDSIILSYIRDRNERNFKKYKDWLLKYDISSLDRKSIEKVRTSKVFKDNFISELSKIVALEYLNKQTGKITIKNIGLILAENKNYFDYRIRGVNKPIFKFALEELLTWKEVLNTKLGSKSNNVLKLITDYISYHKPVILISKRNERRTWRTHRFLNEHYFKKINSIEKAYILGFFFGDGRLRHYRDGRRNRISFRVGAKDIRFLYFACGELGLNPNSIYKRKEVAKNGRIVFLVEIEFTSDIMSKDLLDLGYVGSKTGETQWPNMEFNNYKNKDENYELLLAFLLGFFDAEGWQGTSTIEVKGKKILEAIKEKFGIPYEISPRKDNSGKYILSLGPKIMNLMQLSFLKSLPRKRKIFHPKHSRFDFDKTFSRKELEYLIEKIPTEVISEIFGICVTKIEELIKKYSLQLKPSNYWDLLRRIEV